VTATSIHDREALGRELIAWARACVREAAGGPSPDRPSAAWCSRCSATFVTLRWPDGTLQGCIGTLRTSRVLVDDIAHNAVAAAVRDPRARRLSLDEVDDLAIEVSLLSALEPLTHLGDGYEARLRESIRIGVDGLVLEHGYERATLLPSMWKTLRDLDTFLEALAHKARLPRAGWNADHQLSRYTTEVFASDEVPE